MFQGWSQKRFLAVGKVAGRQFLAGSSQLEGRWEWAETVGRAEQHPKEQGLPPLGGSKN